MKRPRSPDPGTDLPCQKRLTVMTDMTIPLPPPLFFNSGPNELCQSRSSTMICSDDNWVAQTRGLSIESPLPLQQMNEALSLPVAHRDREREEYMGMDCDSLSKPQICSSQRPNNPSRSPIPRIQDSHSPSTLHSPTSTERLNTPPPYAHFPSSGPTTDYFIHSSRTPYINLQPATPSEGLSRNGSADSAMSVSSTSSQKSHIVGTPISLNVRKQKFTMGPRGDCEKCRMGVKGHWMHFD